jgi:hypothetical protein
VLEFRDLRVHFDEDNCSFQAHILRPEEPREDIVLNGRFWLGKAIITTFTDKRADSRSA